MAQWLSAPVDEDDHARGPADAPVTLVEYGDYACPYTAKAFGVVEQLQDRFGDRLRVVFRHFPLVDAHPRAMPAALTAEAAADGGEFWLMHALLLAHQDRLEDGDLRGYAERLGLATEGAVGARAREHLDRVERDLHSGQDSAVPRTPTFFVNGLRFEDERPDLASLSAAVTAELA